jgi:hypothetical protein
LVDVLELSVERVGKAHQAAAKVAGPKKRHLRGA